MRRISFLAILALLATGIVSADPSTARIPLADGFDYPVGIPDAENYYVYRGYRAHGHLGDDWNGNGGGNTDLRDPVHSIAHGRVVLARDVRKGWGNCVIIRHAYRSPASGKVEYVDSLYAHLDFISVREGQQIKRGDQVGGIGTNRGMYTAHLHLELRKNLAIGMNRMQFARDDSNYLSPRHFIAKHRKLADGGKRVSVPIDTFEYEHRYASPSKIRKTESTESTDRAEGGPRFLLNRLLGE